MLYVLSITYCSFQKLNFFEFPGLNLAQLSAIRYICTPNMGAMYEILRGLPLFKGTGCEQISAFLEKTHVEFVKHAPGDVICEAGKQCVNLQYVISGTVSERIELNEGKVIVTQTLGEGKVFSPANLFGLDTVHPSRVVSQTEGTLMLISKSQYFDALNADPLLVLNYINYLSFYAQKRFDVLRNMYCGHLNGWLQVVRSGITDRHARNVHISTCRSSLATILGIGATKLEQQLMRLAAEGMFDYDSDLEIRMSF